MKFIADEGVDATLDGSKDITALAPIFLTHDPSSGNC
jgi:hypothetical protein